MTNKGNAVQLPEVSLLIDCQPLSVGERYFDKDRLISVTCNVHSQGRSSNGLCTKRLNHYLTSAIATLAFPGATETKGYIIQRDKVIDSEYAPPFFESSLEASVIKQDILLHWGKNQDKLQRTLAPANAGNST